MKRYPDMNGMAISDAAERRVDANRKAAEEECRHCGKFCGGLCQRQINELTRLLLLAESRLLAKEAALDIAA